MRWSVAARITGAVRRPRDEPMPANSLTDLDERQWQRFGRLSLVGRRAARAGLGGEHRSRMRTSANEFVDHRAYQPGDDFRRVDWNVYGRLGSLHIKLTESLERLEVLLVLDGSASMRWGTPDKLAYATQIGAALGYVALRRADVLRVVQLGTGTEASTFGPVRGGAKFPDVLRFLSQTHVAAGSEVSLAAHLTHLRVSTSSPLVVVISDFLEPDTAALGAALDGLACQGGDVAMIQVLSPQEEEPAAQGTVELVDAETDRRLDVTVSLDGIRRYRARLAAWLADVEALATARGFRYVRIRTDRPTDALVLDDLRRVGLVR